jgi:hypothetical protein
MDKKYCENCKYLKVIHQTGYWKCWCAFFKHWLVPENNDALQSQACIELGAKKC